MVTENYKSFCLLLTVYLLSNTLSFAQVGINTITPTETLHVEGTLRLVDGSQEEGHVLTSDANGVASWNRLSVNAISGVLAPSGTGASIPNNTTNFLQTGATITLPPGRFIVNVFMLMNPGEFSPSDSFIWLRTSFSDNPGANPVVSPDIVGGPFASGGLPGTANFQMLIGVITLNNSTAADKTYHYIAGNIETNLPTNMITLADFGSTTWSENNIVAYPVN